jgi:hypothetical protein
MITQQNEQMKKEIKNPCQLVQLLSRILRLQVFTESLSVKHVYLMVVDGAEVN